MRIIGIDPGEKNIGIAVSDPTGTFARPLTILKHETRTTDAESIAAIAVKNDAELIVVGQALDVDGEPTLSGRRAARLAAAIRKHTDSPVILWDESHSTQKVLSLQGGKFLSRRYRKRRNHIDDLAAANILQSYLDNQVTK